MGLAGIPSLEKLRHLRPSFARLCRSGVLQSAIEAVDISVALSESAPEEFDKACLRHWLILAHGIPKVSQIVHCHSGRQNQDVFLPQSRHSLPESIVLIRIFILE